MEAQAQTQAQAQAPTIAADPCPQPQLQPDTPDPNERRKRATVLALNRDGEVLLVRNQEHNERLWSLPGDWMDGRSAIEAAASAIRTMVGLSVTEAKRLHGYDCGGNFNVHRVVRVFVDRRLGPDPGLDPQISLHERMWWDFGDEIPLWPAAHQILAQYVATTCSNSKAAAVVVLENGQTVPLTVSAKRRAQQKRSDARRLAEARAKIDAEAESDGGGKGVASPEFGLLTA